MFRGAFPFSVTCGDLYNAVIHISAEREAFVTKLCGKDMYALTWKGDATFFEEKLSKYSNTLTP
ncbi:MAG: hypothetical protein IJV70_03945 [Clostridia bacterium]|nr:hypothetical protein [Clostridia bacterium]